jgi:hypothetical protein
MNVASYGPWRVELIRLTEPARAIPRACLPAVAATHLAVTLHGMVVAQVDRADGLAAVLPRDVLEAMAAQGMWPRRRQRGVKDSR